MRAPHVRLLGLAVSRLVTGFIERIVDVAMVTVVISADELGDLGFLPGHKGPCSCPFIGSDRGQSPRASRVKIVQKSDRTSAIGNSRRLFLAGRAACCTIDGVHCYVSVAGPALTRRGFFYRAS